MAEIDLELGGDANDAVSSEPSSHVMRVEALLERVVNAVEKHTEILQAIVEAGRYQAQVTSKQAAAQRVAAIRDSADRGAGKKER